MVKYTAPRWVKGVGAVLCLCAGVGFTSASQGNNFTIVTHDQTPVEEQLIFQAFADYLSLQLGEFGYTRGEAVVSMEIAESARRFKSLQAEMIIDSPITTLLTATGAPANIILRRWKFGEASYHSVFFVKTDSRIYGLDDLKGKTLAFVTPGTDSGFIVPSLELRLAGHKLIEVQTDLTPSSTGIPIESIGYVFSGEMETTITWVLYNKVDVGVFHDTYLEQRFPHYERHFRIIHRTQPIPRHVVALRPNLPPALVARIKEILTNLHTHQQGQEILRAFQNTTKFDEVPDEQLQVLMSYAPLLEMPK